MASAQQLKVPLRGGRHWPSDEEPKELVGTDRVCRIRVGDQGAEDRHCSAGRVCSSPKETAMADRETTRKMSGFRMVLRQGTYPQAQLPQRCATRSVSA